MKTVIYIAGKVTNEDPIECLAKFEEVRKHLELKNFEVITPFSAAGKSLVTSSAAQFNRKIALKGCDAIYMLPCSDKCIEAHSDLQDAINYNQNLIIYHELETVEADGTNDNLHT